MDESRWTPERLRRLASLARRHAVAFESVEMGEVADYVERQADLSTSTGDIHQRYHDALAELEGLRGADRRAKDAGVKLAAMVSRLEAAVEFNARASSAVQAAERRVQVLERELEGMRYWHSLAVNYMERVREHIPDSLQGLIAPQAAAAAAVTAIERKAEVVRCLRKVRHWASLWVNENDDAQARNDIALADRIIEEQGK